jgi:hypothetical protein
MGLLFPRRQENFRLAAPRGSVRDGKPDANERHSSKIQRAFTPEADAWGSHGYAGDLKLPRRRRRRNVDAGVAERRKVRKETAIKSREINRTTLAPRCPPRGPPAGPREKYVIPCPRNLEATALCSTLRVPATAEKLWPCDLNLCLRSTTNSNSSPISSSGRQARAIRTCRGLTAAIRARSFLA